MSSCKILKIIAVVVLVAGCSNVEVKTVTVPDLPAAALVAAVEKDVGLTNLNVAYIEWDFIRDERGKTYEVVTWAPKRGVSSEEVREHFAALGGGRPYCGNTAVFLQWVRMNRRDGWFASLPEEDRLIRDADGDLYAPDFGRGGADRHLYLYRVAGDWGSRLRVRRLPLTRVSALGTRNLGSCQKPLVPRPFDSPPAVRWRGIFHFGDGRRRLIFSPRRRGPRKSKTHAANPSGQPKPGGFSREVLPISFLGPAPRQ